MIVELRGASWRGPQGREPRVGVTLTGVGHTRQVTESRQRAASPPAEKTGARASRNVRGASYYTPTEVYFIPALEIPAHAKPTFEKLTVAMSPREMGMHVRLAVEAGRVLLNQRGH